LSRIDPGSSNSRSRGDLPRLVVSPVLSCNFPSFNFFSLGISPLEMDMDQRLIRPTWLFVPTPGFGDSPFPRPGLRSSFSYGNISCTAGSFFPFCLLVIVGPFACRNSACPVTRWAEFGFRSLILPDIPFHCSLARFSAFLPGVDDDAPITVFPPLSRHSTRSVERPASGFPFGCYSLFFSAFLPHSPRCSVMACIRFSFERVYPIRLPL